MKKLILTIAAISMLSGCGMLKFNASGSVRSAANTTQAEETDMSVEKANTFASLNQASLNQDS